MNGLYPCTPWPIDPACCPDWPADPQQWQQRHRDAQMRATTELWRAVAGVIGLCRTVVRPCLDDCQDRDNGGGWSGWMMPHMRGGEWFNGCGCQGSCSCTRLCTVTLPGPVHLVESVRQDGTELAASAWRQITGDRVARVDGQCWPVCQDFSQPDSSGFTVTYQRGIPPGLDAVAAVSALACRMLRECGPGGDCGQLPAGVEAMNRDGMSMRFASDNDLNNYGLRVVNDFVASINPHGLGQPASVWSPDIDEPVVYYQGPVT